MYKAVKARYSKRENGKTKYITKTLKFENGAPLTSLSDGGDCVWVDFGAIKKLVLSQCPEKSQLIEYKLIEA